MANKDMAAFLEALEEGADLLDRLNEAYPNLANDFTKETVIEFRRRPAIPQASQSDDADISTKATDQKLIETTKELLAIHSFEDVLEILQTEHGITIDLTQLVNLVGSKAYISALRREAREFQSNAISLPQIVQLWKDFGRPPIGDAVWTASSVSMILE